MAIKKWKFELSTSVILANCGFLAIAVWYYWPYWWLAVNSDRSPRAWFFSVQLAAIGFASILCFYLSRLVTPLKRQNILWLFLGLGFLYLALDKHFSLHEMYREEFFIPHHIGTKLPGIRPGDITPLFYAAGGIAISFAIARMLKTTKNWLLMGAVLLAAVAVVLDIGDFWMASNATQRLMQFVEKILQTGSQVMLLVFIVEQNCRFLEILHEKR